MKEIYVATVIVSYLIFSGHWQMSFVSSQDTTTTFNYSKYTLWV